MEKRYWFGPRRFGWGWSPRTWEGWLVIVVGLIGILATPPLIEPRFGVTAAGLSPLGWIAVLLAICVWKGSGPGGPRAWSAERNVRATRRAGVKANYLPDPPIEEINEHFDHLHDKDRPKDS